MAKKIYRSSTDYKIAGICGGIAEYLNLDATLIRVLWILVILLGGSGFLAYFICWLLIPDRPDIDPHDIIDG